MNKSIVDIQGEILIISQFTLMALTKKLIDHPILNQLP